MKRLLAALLALLSCAVQAQEYQYSDATQTGNLVPDPTFTGTPGTVPDGWQQSGDPWSGGAIQTNCGAYDPAGQCYQWSYMGGFLTTTIDLTQFNTNSFEFFFDFLYRMNCNNNIGGYCENPDGVRDTFGVNLRFYDSQGETAFFNFIPIAPDYFVFGDPGVNQYDYKGVGWYSSQTSTNLFDRIVIEFYGKDEGFWGGYYGPSIDDVSFRIGYLAYVPPTPEFLYWNRVASEYEQFTITEETVVRYGANGVYAYQTLQAGTYDCGNGLFGDPIGGVVKSCEVGSNEEPVIAVNCEINPFNPTCIINSTIEDATNDTTMLAEETSTTADEEDPPVEEDLVAMIEEAFDDPYEEVMEESLEELLAEEISDDDEEETVAVKEVVASSSPIKEMANEEKASTLSDSISKDVLESALSIASAAETSGTSGGSSSESTSSSSSSSSRSGSASGGGSEIAVASVESSSSSVSFDSFGQEQSAAGDASMELLETGRSLGQEALATTMAATEASASDSMSQAESIAQTSSFDSMTASSATAETINSIEIENVIETVATTESNADSMEMMGAAETNSKTGVVSDGSEMFASMENNPGAASVQEAEDVALAVVNNSIASGEQKTFEDETNKDAELTTAMVDPALALANTFNQPPSMMNLEILGIVKPIEEKSDAERSAEKVVAANKEEQEKINANYMDADQSGIVAAIAVDADVSSYLSARLMDNNVWYKPEDIYNNVKINDNKRGAYFLEKGNTDTYKKMVEEQYK